MRACHMRLWLAACLLVGGVLGATPASAHVKWFEAADRYPLRLDLVWSERTILWLASSAAALIALFLAQRVLVSRKWFWTGALTRVAAGAPTVLAIQAAIGLVSNAVHPSLLAPNLELPSGVVGATLALVQLLIAVSFITGVGDWLGGLALMSLIPVTALLFSPADALEQIFWAGIGAAVVVIGRDAHRTGLARPWFRRRNPAWARRAIVMLRAAAGLSLIVVALTEKLWNPDLGRAFLLAHPELNVFQSLPGMGWFSDDMFVLMAGLAEAAIGAMLVAGLAPRLVILAMWLPFNLGIPVLPSQELLGHLPMLGIMYVLLVDGADLVPARPVRVPRVVATSGPARLRYQMDHDVHGGVATGRFPSRNHSTSANMRERELVESREE
jgi:hypothetical protein